MTYGQQTAYKSLEYKKTSHTSQQSGSTSFGTVTVIGSEITYTPSENATQVVYEINFYGQRTDDIHNSAFILEQNTGTWAEVNNQNARTSVNSGTGSQANRDTYHLRLVIPAWTGSRQLRLVLGTRVANNQIILHQLTEWDGSTVSNQFADTTLIVYSI